MSSSLRSRPEIYGARSAHLSPAPVSQLQEHLPIKGAQLQEATHLEKPLSPRRP